MRDLRSSRTRWFSYPYPSRQAAVFVTLEAEPRESEGQYLVTTPNGSVTIVVDRVRGVCRVYSESEPDPCDWGVACQYIAGVGGRMGGAWAEGEVDVFEIVGSWGYPPRARQAG